MSPHFCTIGKIKPNLNKLTSLKQFENRIANFVEDKSKVVYSEELRTAF